MPSGSEKQARFMEMIAHNLAMAKKHKISQETARHFIEADKRAGKYSHVHGTDKENGS